MSQRIIVWAPAPNRHFEAILDAMVRAGALEHVYYFAEQLRWNQLGTPPASRGPETETRLARAEQTADRIRGLVRRHLGATHLVVGLGHSTCWKTLRACRREGATAFLWVESLQPRPFWHPTRIIRTAIYRSLLRDVAGVLALTRGAATDFHRLGVARERIHAAMWAGPDDQRRYSRPDRERVVYCGRLIALKGIDLLCRAVREVGTRRAGLALDVVGDGPERLQLRLLDGAPVEVAVHGALPSGRAREVVARASVLVLPTRRREGWGYVVNEAVAAAVPTVVSSAVGAAELVVPSRTGFVFPEGDAAALARAIEAALDLHLDGSALAAAFQTMQEGVTSDAIVRYLLRILSGGGTALPPWLACAKALGGNGACAWWAAWVRAGADPLEARTARDRLR
jgi:glycosyltransferase involved in cell wall biosynthesis